MRTINEIIIHCAATRADWMADETVQAKTDEIRRWHIDQRGWDDIGYHFIIDRDGSICNGRDKDQDGDIWEEIGAHTRGHNRTSLGVCLIGGHGTNENDAFLDNYTPAQERALREWIELTRDRFPSIKKVSGHNEYAAKACPGFNVKRWLKGKPPATVTAKTVTDVVKVAAPAAGGLLAAFGGLNPIVQGILAVGVVAVVGFIAWQTFGQRRAGA